LIDTLVRFDGRVGSAIASSRSSNAPGIPLRDGLDRLQSAEFLYESSLFPDLEIEVDRFEVNPGKYDIIKFLNEQAGE
jgi:hypothetical protein